MRNKSEFHRVWRIAGFLILAGYATVRADTTNTPRQSPYAVVQPVSLKDVTWTDGFWADRFDVLRTCSISAMWEIMRGNKYKPYLQHFLIAAGDIPGEYHGAQWNDGDFYKFLEAVCAVNAIKHDDKLDAILDQSIAAIGKAQRVDGYIHTPVLIRQRHGDLNAKPFQDRHNFEMYNMGHLITAACLHHHLTGRTEFLDTARKTADFMCESFSNPTPELARNSVCPSHYMAVIDLYRETGEARYLDLAKTFLQMRSLVTDGGDDNQDRIPFGEQREAMGHAVRANYLYAGAADLFLESGDSALRTSLDAIWKNVVEKKVYITGGCGALYDGASPDGSSDQSSISRVHQAYGRNFQLPNVTAHNETCAAVGNMLWNWRMFEATGEAKYVDVFEVALYNAVLAGVSLDGTKYFYVNPLRRTDPLPTKLRWPRERVLFMTSYCCPPNVLRTVAEVGGQAYSTSEQTIWINLYGSNRVSTSVDGQRVTLLQETQFPWEGNVKVTVEKCPLTELSLKMRIPGWASDAALTLNGSPTSAPLKAGSYVEVRRKWEVGDSVELDLRMKPTLIEANPLVEETRGQVAIMRGPIVYCLESPDLPKGVRVQDVIVGADAGLTSRFDANLLNGITVVKAKCSVKPSGDWDGKLYRTLAATPARPIDATFIPYNAWANRGPSEMSVWLPVK